MCPAYLQQAEGLISDESDVSSTGGGEEERKNKKKISQLCCLSAGKSGGNKMFLVCFLSSSDICTLFSAEKVFNFQLAQNAAGLSLVLG